MRLGPILGAVLWVPAVVLPAPAQSMQPADLGAGKLLVASPDLTDPNFSKTVVLLVQYDQDGVVGLIVNRRSKVPVSRVLDNIAGAKKRTDPVYAGGPVEMEDVLALVESQSAPAGAKRVVGNVYLLSTKDSLEKAFGPAAASSRVHIYLGYSGWTMPQLSHETDLGAWYIFRGDAAAVFDSDPDSLWPRLIRETQLRVARALTPPR